MKDSRRSAADRADVKPEVWRVAGPPWSALRGKPGEYQVLKTFGPQPFVRRVPHSGATEEITA